MSATTANISISARWWFSGVQYQHFDFIQADRILMFKIQQTAWGGDEDIDAAALILTPTRELAAQVGENVRDYSKYLNIRSLVVFGAF
jgi:hypothetical protein